ncbi:MAG: RNA-binding protein, partial [Microbacterium sp. 14-71-5]
MIFTDDTEETLRAAVWLANSAEDPDTLTSLSDEATFLSQFGYTGRIDRDQAELEGLREIRPQLRAMLLAPRDDMAIAVNEALAGIALTPRLARHGTLDWHLHAVA